MKGLNLVNEKFHRLLVIEQAPHVKNRSAWLCMCDCGNFKIVKTDELRSSGTKSCGCLNDEKRKQRARKMYSGNIKYSPKEATARKIWRNSYADGISFEDFHIISQNNCYYCGGAPSNVGNAAKSDQKASKYAKENGNFVYNGLDRLDSLKNHDINNVVPCCKYCNYAKRERTLEEFKEWVSKIYLKWLQD